MSCPSAAFLVKKNDHYRGMIKIHLAALYHRLGDECKGVRESTYIDNYQRVFRHLYEIIPTLYITNQKHIHNAYTSYVSKSPFKIHFSDGGVQSSEKKETTKSAFVMAPQTSLSRSAIRQAIEYVSIVKE